MAMKRLGDWWRLWVIPTALWLSVITFLAIQSKPDFSMPEGTEVRDNVPAEVLRLVAEGRRTMLMDDRDYIVIETASGYKITLPEDATREQISGAVKAYEESISKLRPISAWVYGLAYLGFGLLPPLGLLLAGYIARWVWSGFKD